MLFYLLLFSLTKSESTVLFSLTSLLFSDILFIFKLDSSFLNLSDFYILSLFKSSEFFNTHYSSLLDLISFLYLTYLSFLRGVFVFVFNTVVFFE